MHNCIFEAQEHGNNLKEKDLDLEILEILNNEENEFKYLNIRKEENQAIAYYYIGYRWFEKIKVIFVLNQKYTMAKELIF